MADVFAVFSAVGGTKYFSIDDSGNVFYSGTMGTTTVEGGAIYVKDSTKISWGDGQDITIQWDGAKLIVEQAATNSAIDIGVSGAGIDVVFYGDTATRDVTWDQSADSLIFKDNAKLVFGTGSDDTLSHDGTDTLWTHITGNCVIDNTLVTGKTIFRLGTDTTATAFEVRNNSDAIMWQVTPLSATAGTFLGADGSRIAFGSDADSTFTHDGTTGLDIGFAANDSGAIRFLEGSTEWLVFDSSTNQRRLDAKQPLDLQQGFARIERCLVDEDFQADAGATLPKPWGTQDTSAAGAPTLNYVADAAGGIFRLATSVTDELQTLTLYWADQLTIDVTKAPIMEARIRMNFEGATFSADQRFVVGLASARNATLDSVVTHAWFRVEGANLNILKETDDGTTDTDDTDTTIDIVDNTWTRLRIDMTTLAAVAFSVDGVAAGGAAMSIPLASGNLQPFIEQQKDAGAEVETLDIDYVLISWAR